MVSVNNRRWESLERWSPTLFLVGGTLVVGHAAIRGIEAFTEMTPPPDVFAPVGYLLAVLGLFGLYPSLADETPRVARVAAVAAAAPLAGWAVIAVWSFGDLAGGLAPPADVLPGAFYVAHIASVVLTYALFGVASLRADAHSRTVGLLLLAPAVVFLALIAGMGVVAAVGWMEFAVDGGHALAHLAIGLALRTGGVPTDRADPAADATP